MLSGLLLFFFTQVLLVSSLAQTDICGGNIVIHTADYLTSPGYPSAYPPSQQCVWVITAPEPSQRILINFNPHFDLEDRECKYDYVEVYNGGDEFSPMLGKFCGKIAPAPIVSTGGQLLIKFVSDYETHGAGFSVRYEVFKTGPECSRNFTAPTGVIKSPGFPDKYPNNLDCTIMIFAPKMSEIVVEFDSFDMEPDTTPPPGAQCRYDFLEIWDGFPAVGPHIGRYCGQTSPGRVISYTGVLSMTITTDNAIVKEGFSANYTIRERSRPPGYEDNDSSCDEPLGMESGEIPSEHITASSQYNSNWSPERSRLNYPENGWTPSDDTIREWIQVDLGQDKMVSGVMIQGGKHRDRNVFMKKFKVGHSLDGDHWTFIKEENTTRAKVFTGNQNHETPEVRTVGLLRTRFVRIYPERATTEGIGLRLELLGCELEDLTSPAPPTTPLGPTFFVTTFGATTTAPTTVPSTTQSLDCDEGQLNCGTEAEGLDLDETEPGGTATANSVTDMPAYVWFACSFDTPSLCGWNGERSSGAEWVIHTSEESAVHRGPIFDHTGRPGNFIHMQLTDRDAPSKTGGENNEEDRVARLISPSINTQDTSLCMSFWYHLSTGHNGALLVKYRRDEEAILWVSDKHKGSRWREGRVSLPRSSHSFQVVVEGIADRHSTGHIAVDNIQIMDGLSSDDCRDPEVPTSPPTEILMLPIDSFSQDSGKPSGQSNMLETLDPILITIIAMSALGVFLGAICGVVLYCACSQGSMTDRNLSALENYNFELVDGVKLKKDKMNGQTNNYSEA
uniref:Neuropilin-1a n=1 Tax=Oryzias latipes TaxID=8090 RepID=A0A3P9JBC1_ORYLA